MVKILIIDDDESICYSMKRSLSKSYDIYTALNSVEAYEILCNTEIDFIFLDYQLGDQNGLDVLKEIRLSNDNIPVAFLTAHGTSEVLIDAIRYGAVDFLSKPVDAEKLIETIEKYAGCYSLCYDSELFEKLPDISEQDMVIAESNSMKEILKKVAIISATRTPVIITGDSGTGKDVIAHLIHRYSPRKDKPFVSINCAAIPEQLLESELFGHVKGSFTGAVTNKQGKFQIADTGTIFLDEIGDMPAELQGKLLHVLQDGLIQRIGDNSFQKTDIRIISATNKNMEQIVNDGLFREDLFYRINAFEIKIPPLRNRREDIWPLSMHYLKQQAVEVNKNITCIEKSVRKLLEAQDWQGNVRELKNTMAKLIVMTSSNSIRLETVQEILSFPKESHEDIFDYFMNKSGESLLQISVEELEMNLIKRCIAESAGNHTLASKKLGISRVTLYDKIKKYNI